MESADEAAHRIAKAKAERYARQKEAKRRNKESESFTQTQREKQQEVKQSIADRRASFRDRMDQVQSTTNKGQGNSSLHLAAKGAVKSAIKGTLKGAAKLAKKALQRDN